MNFYPGLRLEAKDLTNDEWYSVKVVEVDEEENEILIHFEKWSQRYDEWIPMNSSRLRPIYETLGDSTEESIEVFKSGDNVMALWYDRRKYPAIVKTVLGNDKYKVRFHDGFTRNLKGGNISRLSEELAKIELLKSGIGPNNDVTNSPSSSFAPMINPAEVVETTLSSKEEKSEDNRKLNVPELFHFKKKLRVRTSMGIAKNPSEELSSVKSSKTAVSKGNISVETEENLMNGSETNLEFAGTKKRKPALKPEKNRRRSKYDSSQGVGKKGCKAPIAINGGRGRKKGRKQHPFAFARKEGEAGNVASELVMKPLKEYVPKGETAYVVGGVGGPRKSIVVDDPRVPAGWSRHFIQRMSGKSAGKWDVFFVSPQGRKFRTKPELISYYEDRGEAFPSEQFDFSLGRRKNKSYHIEHDETATPLGLGSESSQQMDVIPSPSSVFVKEEPHSDEGENPDEPDATNKNVEENLEMNHEDELDVNLISSEFVKEETVLQELDVVRPVNSEFVKEEPCSDEDEELQPVATVIMKEELVETEDASEGVDPLAETSLPIGGSTGEALADPSHLDSLLLTPLGNCKCSFCGLEFPEEGMLLQHVTICHHEERPLKCNICSQAFAKKLYLMNHILTHSSDHKHKCDVCGRSYSLLSSLKTHLKNHSGEWPFKCMTCGKTFSLLYNFKAHMRIHAGVKLFPCEVCGKSFGQNCNRQSHMRTHTGEMA